MFTKSKRDPNFLLFRPQMSEVATKSDEQNLEDRGEKTDIKIDESGFYSQYSVYQKLLTHTGQLSENCLTSIRKIDAQNGFDEKVLSSELRDYCVHVIIQFCSKNNLHEEIVFYSISLLDHFFSQIEPNHISIILNLITFILISSKMQNSLFFNMPELISQIPALLNETIPKSLLANPNDAIKIPNEDEIVQYEITLYNKANYDFLVVSPLNFIFVYLGKIPDLSYPIFQKVFYQSALTALFSIKNSLYHKFTNEEIGVTALKLSLDEVGIDSSSFEFSPSSECIKFVQTYYSQSKDDDNSLINIFLS